MAKNDARPAYTARPGEAVFVFRSDDGSFAIGVGRLSIARDDILFAFDVVKDLARLVCMPEGEEALRLGDAIGRTVRIEKPDPPTTPPNAWVLPDDLAAAAGQGVSLGQRGGSAATGTGAGCGSTIVYTPGDWPRRGDPHSPSSVEVLLKMLRQANRNAQGKSDPSKPGWESREESAGR